MACGPTTCPREVVKLLRHQRVDVRLAETAPPAQPPPARLLSRAERAHWRLIDAAKAAGVKQFTFVSVAFADPNSPVPMWQAKGKTKGYLRESGLPYTIIAPNGYMEALIPMVVGMPAMMGQPVTLVGEGRRKHSPRHWKNSVDVRAHSLTRSW
jgi:uncharacterized protein YbjT (DUF2867 family)